MNKISALDKSRRELKRAIAALRRLESRDKVSVRTYKSRMADIRRLGGKADWAINDLRRRMERVEKRIGIVR